MAERPEDYGLDLHCTMMLEEYRRLLPMFTRMKAVVLEQLENCMRRSNLIVSAIQARVKQEDSLAGKLDIVKLVVKALKGDYGAMLIAFGSVVKYNIKNYFNAVVV